MIKDISSSIKTELYGRAVSPLFGTFFLSWSVWNWKFWLVIFSSMEVSEKLDFLDGVLYYSWLQPAFFLFLGPLITSIMYIYLYPIPARIVYRYSGNQKKKLKAIKVAIEDETPLTQEEHNKLRKKTSNLESAYYAELASKDSEIDRLRALIASPGKNPNNSSSVQGSSGTKSVIYQPSKQFPLTDTDQPVITELEIKGETYVLGKDFDKSRPGETNIINLKSEFNYQDIIHVTFKTNKSLLESQYYQVFDGHSIRKITELSFEIHKTDYEKKNAFFCVMQPNPSRDGRDMVISNKVQFSY